MQPFAAAAVAAAVACLVLGSWGAKAVTLDSLRSISTQPDAASENANAPSIPVSQGKPELMGVKLNGVTQSASVLVLRLANRSIAVPATAIAAWRVRRPEGRMLRFEGDDYVSLDSIAGIGWREDTAGQILILQILAAAFVENELEVVDQEGPTQSVTRLGGFVNYDLQWQSDATAGAGASSRRANGLIEAGMFNAYGNGIASGVWRSGGPGAAFTRLDTTWNIDMPASLSSVRLGDAISVPGSWGRSVRYGGVQWATNFAVQPGLVSFPMPSIRGEASVPSIVDLYINNTHQLQGKVPAGAFDLPDVPVVTGQGQIKMVVRDLLGREQVIVQPYYVSPTLLRPGLRDFAIDVGAVRENYGFDSQRYGRVFLAATNRVGVTPDFTREMRAEILRDQQTVGLAGVWQLKQRATAHVSAAASRGSEGAGWLSVAGIDHQNRSWSANMQLRLASRNFSALGNGTGTGTGSGGPQRSALTAGIAAALGTGTAGLNVLQQSTWQGDSYRSVSANYGRRLGSLGYLSLFASRTFGSVNSTTVGINLTTLLAGNVSASVGTYRSRDRLVDSNGSLGAANNTGQTAVQIQGNAPVGPGFGYQVQAERGSFERFSAQGTVQGERAAVNAGVARLNGADSYQLGVRGAVALMPEGVYLSHRIDGSFAVVQVGDYGGIRVNRDNQLVARTDEKGRAFVTGLRGFESNQISIEQRDLPLDAQVDRLKIAVTPGIRSGVSVLFPVQRARAASLRLVTADGVPVPPGVTVQIEGDVREFPVGFDGKVFLVGLRDTNQISAQWSGHRCTAQIALDGALDDIPELGTRVCK